TGLRPPRPQTKIRRDQTSSTPARASAMQPAPRTVYEFGRFRADPHRRALFKDSKPIALTPKAFDLLLVLLRRPLDVVSKDELMDELWPRGFVEEGNLSQNVFVLRKALGESAHDHRYVVTLPGRGYRFAAPVRTVALESEDVVVHRRVRAQI